MYRRLTDIMSHIQHLPVSWHHIGGWMTDPYARVQAWSMAQMPIRVPELILSLSCTYCYCYIAFLYIFSHLWIYSKTKIMAKKRTDGQLQDGKKKTGKMRLCKSKTQKI